MKPTTLTILAAVLLLSGCATADYRARPTRPLIQREVMEIGPYVSTFRAWDRAHPDDEHATAGVYDTHSMEPYIYTGDVVLFEKMTPQTVLVPGQVVAYNQIRRQTRRPSLAYANILHMIDAIDGDRVHIVALNGAFGEWVYRSQIHHLAVRVVGTERN